MHIVKIEVKNCAFSTETGQYRAILLVEAAESSLCLHAVADLAEHSPSSAVLQRLVEDVFRQIRRLPEYRNTARTITLADGALPRLG